MVDKGSFTGEVNFNIDGGSFNVTIESLRRSVKMDRGGCIDRGSCRERWKR
jgi:hypothetical protein